MRLIPGKTKVQLELFKGVYLSDLLIGGIGAFLLLFMLTSTIPGKLFISIGIAVIFAGLLARVDYEPNYLYLLQIIRHYSYTRSFSRLYSDEELERRFSESAEQVAFEYVFNDSPDEPKKQELTKAEKKALKKAQKAEKKADDKLLKRKDVSEEEKDAIWKKRAEQSAARKKEMDSSKNSKRLENANEMLEINSFTGIKDDFIEFDGKYFGAVIEIPPVEFRFMSETRRTNAIDNSLGRVLRSIPADYAANIVKIERPVLYDTYLDHEYSKLEDLKAAYEKGAITEEEMKIRVEILYDRINDLRTLCYEDKIILPYYYLVLYDGNRQQLTNSVRSALDLLRAGEMNPHRLSSKEIAVFLRYTNEIDFDEREIEKIAPDDYVQWAMPKTVIMTPRTAVVNGMVTHNFKIVNYPVVAGDAWLATVMSMPSTKVVLKCEPMDRAKAIRGIDNSLTELRGQFASTNVSSKMMELQEHIETLETLLATLQGESETLLEVNVYVTAYDVNLTRKVYGESSFADSARVNIENMKKYVRRTYQEHYFRLNNMEFDQVNAYIGGQISSWDPLRGKGRGIPSNTVAASFPWVFAHVSDENGMRLGQEEGVPVFIDFFRRDSERINSNMVIVGKSGSGKSFATKSLLANLAADDAKIFILDPENEYSELAKNLHGKFINVGNAVYGRLNPFHIITALDDDESDGGSVSGSYATHLQFLEEFFRQIMPECDKAAMEYLNALVDRMYTNLGITAETNLSLLEPEDYPTFDDLYDSVLAEFQSTDNEYIRTMLRTLMNYVAKFSTGGRNANIWNGPSSITTDENFTVFNFQSLLSNRNNTIANAQMLLVLKYIDNEIIKNRDYNTKYGLNRKIVVVIDEAHVFIDTKFPVALDFMFQLAKRIRKYNGMQIVITQNIKDFVGSDEIARKSTAIINACQYSFIFSLAPNDMQDLCTLYEKAGGINEQEQEQIISAPRGQAFTIMSPQSRSTFRVEVPEDIVAMFSEPDYQTRYFDGEEGNGYWEDFVADSREKRKLVESISEKVKETRDQGKTRTHVKLQTVTEEELAAAEIAKPVKRVSVKPVAEPEEIVDDFPDIPEIPENPEDFIAMNIARNAVAAEIPQAVAPVAAPVVPVQPQQSSNVEQMLSELLAKLSYDSMVREIKRSVKEEIDAIKPAETIKPAEESTPAEIEHEVPASQIPVFGGTAIPVQNTTKTASLGSIFNEDAIAESERIASEEAAEPEIDDDDTGFDIMKMLAAEVEHMESISPIDMMVEYDEDVIQITLEELAVYNKRHNA